MFIYYFNKIRISREVVQVCYNSDKTSSDRYISKKEIFNKKLNFALTVYNKPQIHRSLNVFFMYIKLEGRKLINTGKIWLIIFQYYIPAIIYYTLNYRQHWLHYNIPTNYNLVTNDSRHMYNISLTCFIIIFFITYNNTKRKLPLNRQT